MWLFFGVSAIVATFFNLYLYQTGKNYHLAMALALSFTALTLVASYSMIANWVILEDWAAISDVVPTMTTVFWVLVFFSILLNIIPAFLELKNKN